MVWASTSFSCVPLNTASRRVHTAGGSSGSNVLTVEVQAALLQEVSRALQRLEKTVSSPKAQTIQRSLLRCSLGRPCQVNMQTHLNSDYLVQRPRPFWAGVVIGCEDKSPTQLSLVLGVLNVQTREASM